MAILFTDCQEKEIAASYASGQTSAALACAWRCTAPTITKAIRSQGGLTRQWHGGHVVTFYADEKRTICEKYLAGIGVGQLSRHFHRSTRTIYTVLREHGITPRTRSESMRKYALDEEFFSSIDTEEKAWALGFITADGYVNGIVGQLEVTLGRIDRDAIETLKRILKSGNPIDDYEAVSYGAIRPYSRITFNSKRMIADLAAFGVVRKKSFTVPPWNGPEHLLPHYFRGLVDGDGSIYHTTEGKWGVALCGNLRIVTAFSDFVKKHVATTTQVHPRASIFQISFRGSALPQDVARLLYGNATVALARKKAAADKLLSITPHHACPRRARVVASATAGL